MAEDRLKVLKLVAAGVLSPDQAEDLLTAMDARARAVSPWMPTHTFRDDEAATPVEEPETAGSRS